MNEASDGDRDNLSSLGDASPLDDGGALQAQRAQRCRAKVQKYCSFAFVAIYALVYLSLSSNPEVALSNSAYNYGQTIGAMAVGEDGDGEVSKNAAESIPGNHTPGIGSIEEQKQPSWHQHFQQAASTIARVYQPLSPSAWCIDGRLKFEQGKGRPMGLCYLKIPRAASSTLVGINVRIARNFAVRNGVPETCIRHDGSAPGFRYRQRETSLSYLWTFVRDPAERAMSRVASNLAKRQSTLPPSSLVENYTLEALKTSTDIQFGAISEGRGGFQVQYAMLRVIEENTFWNASQPAKVRKPQRLHQVVKDILENYNFIGTVERLDESLVAMQLLLGLETADILYLSSSFPYRYTRTTIQGHDNAVCQKNIDPHILRTEKVNEYLSGVEWGAKNYGDLLLHRAADLSLDKTIIEIGRDLFSEALHSFRSILQEAHKTCHPVFPCSENGTDQSELAEDDCYFNDIGCGFKCLDSFYDDTM